MNKALKPQSIEDLFGERMAADGTLVRENFAYWFGNSAVVDEVGMPLIVFHGTTRDFASFEPSDSRTGHPSAALGHFFSESPSVADIFSRDLSNASGFADPQAQPFAERANTVPVYLAVRNPKVFTAAQFKDLMSDLTAPPTEEFGWMRTPAAWRALRSAIESEGFDGVKIGIDRNHYRGSGNEEFAKVQWVAFCAEQIKSAVGNNGLFDRNCSDMTDNRSPKLLAQSAKKASDYLDLVAAPSTKVALSHGRSAP